jgi:site-specific DNA recombinase
MTATTLPVPPLTRPQNVQPVDVAPGAATALMEDFVNGVLRRVDRLIAEGLPPLNSGGIAGYERISDDTEGRKLGVTRQREDNLTMAARDGVELPEHAMFRDNDRGASDRSKKPRFEFERLVAYVLLGEVHTIYAYSNSRLTRRPLEYELFIRLHAKTGVRFVTMRSGSDNLGDADGRMVARFKAAADAGEAERTAERVGRAAEQSRLAGKAAGGLRPFGYQADKVTPHPVEAAMIREAAAALIDGRATLRSIARDWQASGVETIVTQAMRAKAAEAETEEERREYLAKVKAWHPNVVRQLLRNPRLAGWRTYKRAMARDALGQPIRGQWEPIIDQETHDRLTAILNRPAAARQRGARGARVYPSTGILRCGICLGAMHGARWSRGGTDTTTHRYKCAGSIDRPHTIDVGGNKTDDLIAEIVLDRLADKQFDVTPPPFDGDERLAEIGAQLTELNDAYAEGRIKGARYIAMTERLEALQDDLMAERERYIAAMVGPKIKRVTREEWDAMSPGQRRVVAESVLEAVIVKPAVNRSPKLDAARFEPVYREFAA